MSQSVPEQMLAEFMKIEGQMATPEVLSSPDRLRSLGRRYAELGRVVRVYREWLAARDDLAEAKEIVDLGGDDGELFAAEVPGLEKRFAELDEELKNVLIPRDPDDSRDVILEVKAGEGGEESALFAGDLLRMYLRFAENKGWQTQTLSATESDLGGYKVVQVAIKSPQPPEDPADGVWATSSTRPATIASSGCRSPSPRVACTPPPPGCW